MQNNWCVLWLRVLNQTARKSSDSSDGGGGGDNAHDDGGEVVLVEEEAEASDSTDDRHACPGPDRGGEGAGFRSAGDKLGDASCGAGADGDGGGKRDDDDDDGKSVGCVSAMVLPWGASHAGAVGAVLSSLKANNNLKQQLSGGSTTSVDTGGKGEKEAQTDQVLPKADLVLAADVVYPSNSEWCIKPPASCSSSFILIHSCYFSILISPPMSVFQFLATLTEPLPLPFPSSSLLSVLLRPLSTHTVVLATTTNNNHHHHHHHHHQPFPPPPTIIIRRAVGPFGRIHENGVWTTHGRSIGPLTTC
jgi:hypothetical protein